MDPPMLHEALLRIVLIAVVAAILDFAAKVMMVRRFNMVRPVHTAAVLAAEAWILALMLE